MAPVQDVDGRSATQRNWALSNTVTEVMLNRLAKERIGAGVVAETLRQQFEIPMLGSLDVGVDMVIVGVEFSMAKANDGRLAASIRATGDIALHGDSPMPAFPGLAHVRGDVLVQPHVELNDDGTFTAVLDILNSELVGMTLEGIDGVDADAQAQEMMGQMLFASLGGDLFGALAEGIGNIGIGTDASLGGMLTALGVAPGPADIVIRNGSMTVGLRSVEGIDGHAVHSIPIGPHMEIGVASGAMSALANKLISDAVGAPLPFELDVIAGEDRVGARVRNQRLVSNPLFPDLRPGLRYTVKPKLTGDRVELSLSEAWVELPLVPKGINRLNRMIGGLAAAAPLKTDFPASTVLPLGADGAAEMQVSVVDLHIHDDGASFVLSVVTKVPLGDLGNPSNHEPAGNETVQI